ncbi:hypothetical protein Q7C36_002872 [Tachysurus vachellii]|uniref:Zinc finger CCHC domain-containing protein n=1 Tax=Tachysurus vachellii TaxID=175792 RepID=A0AA88NNZ6_TACVA|nr:hypothetical protein Q7C36_002868 [Tachysurus vachellii]KAK2863715.1 hypothetical protein Q7C36_002869 [Tachysurus vachellii]KAK2863717.1 hypothetical protein Q7C36_002871 [Tachysurus vachellii]KAK2863718.1 hypothetical protein Q7C36_002872 [Tachysurus vachellii]
MSRGGAKVPARVVRLKHSVRIQLRADAMEDVRKRFGWDWVSLRILRDFGGMTPGKIFCLQDFTASGFLEVSFNAFSDCSAFFGKCSRFPEEELLRGLSFIPLFAMDEVPIVVHMYNPWVVDEDIRAFLSRSAFSSLFADDFGEMGAPHPGGRDEAATGPSEPEPGTLLDRPGQPAQSSQGAVVETEDTPQRSSSQEAALEAAQPVERAALSATPAMEGIGTAAIWAETEEEQPPSPRLVRPEWAFMESSEDSEEVVSEQDSEMDTESNPFRGGQIRTAEVAVEERRPKRSRKEDSCLFGLTAVEDYNISGAGGEGSQTGAGRHPQVSGEDSGGDNGEAEGNVQEEGGWTQVLARRARKGGGKGGGVVSREGGSDGE